VPAFWPTTVPPAPMAGPSVRRALWRWTDPGPYLVRAYHDSEHGIRVYFSEPVLQASEFNTDDALNPYNWTVVRADGAPIPRLLTVLQLDPVDPTGIRLWFAGPEVLYREIATVTASGTIRGVAGTIPIPPLSMSYTGVARVPRPFQEAQDIVGFPDLANRYGEIRGTSQGDIAMAGSQETIRKMVLRIFTTPAGGFPHLPGWGVAPELKGLMGPVEVSALATGYKQAILSLPGVKDAAVTVTTAPTGILLVRAEVVTINMDTVVVSWSSQPT